jgi:hypothetical protein
MFFWGCDPFTRKRIVGQHTLQISECLFHLLSFGSNNHLAEQSREVSLHVGLTENEFLLRRGERRGAIASTYEIRKQHATGKKRSPLIFLLDFQGVMKKMV